MQNEKWYKIVIPINEILNALKLHGELTKVLLQMEPKKGIVPVSYLSKMGNTVYLIPKGTVNLYPNLLRNYPKILVSDSLENIIAEDTVDGLYEAIDVDI